MQEEIRLSEIVYRIDYYCNIKCFDIERTYFPEKFRQIIVTFWEKSGTTQICLSKRKELINGRLEGCVFVRLGFFLSLGLFLHSFPFSLSAV